MLVNIPSANAQFNPENKIYVYGVVLPKHHVIIDENGQIQEIISNTSEDVTPDIYVGKIAKESQVVLTPEVLAQYNQLVAKGSSHVGTLYKRQIAPPPAPASESQAGLSVSNTLASLQKAIGLSYALSPIFRF